MTQTNTLFRPLRKYTTAEIEQIAGALLTSTPMSYAVVFSVVAQDGQQYDFILFPYDDGDGLVLVAVDGELPKAYQSTPSWSNARSTRR